MDLRVHILHHKMKKNQHSNMLHKIKHNEKKAFRSSVSGVDITKMIRSRHH